MVYRFKITGLDHHLYYILSLFFNLRCLFVSCFVFTLICLSQRDLSKQSVRDLRKIPKTSLNNNCVGTGAEFSKFLNVRSKTMTLCFSDVIISKVMSALKLTNK